MRGQSGDYTRPHARSSPSFLGMDAWMTSQLNVALIRKLRGSLMCLVYVFDMLCRGICTTRHWRPSGRLVQELYVSTVCESKTITYGKELVAVLVFSTGTTLL